MICQKGHIETQCEPLCCTEKHDTEESMDEVLWKNELKGKQSDYHTAWLAAAYLESKWQPSFHFKTSLFPRIGNQRCY